MTDFYLEMDSLGASDGWMKCWLVFGGERHKLVATSVFPPFLSVLRFARAVASNSLPNEFHWEEEGPSAKFNAESIQTDPLKFHLRITHEQETVIDADLDWMQVVSGLIKSLRAFAMDCPGAESEWDFPLFLVEDFERDMALGFPALSEIDRVCDIHFVFGHYGGYGGQEQPAMSIWVDSWKSLYMPMKDIPRFWWMWFEWLEKIGRGEFPAEIVLHVEEGENPDGADFMMNIFDFTRRFHAEAVSEADLFRLKMDILSSRPEVNTSHVFDIVFNRRQFVRAFVEAFQIFLSTSYPLFLEGDPDRFDLRTLSVDRLISTLE